MAKTKRRKAWVTFHEVGSVTHLTRKSAVRGVALSPIGTATEKAVPFVEASPGDVVLSREDAERLRELAHTLRQDARTLLLSLLRGGR